MSAGTVHLGKTDPDVNSFIKINADISQKLHSSEMFQGTDKRVSSIQQKTVIKTTVKYFSPKFF